MDAREVINVVVGLGVAATVASFLYYVVSKISAGNVSAASFFSPLAGQWGTIVIVVALGSAMGFIIPKMLEIQRR